MKMKWQTLILVILFLPIVMADKGTIETYKPREVFDLSIHLTNLTGDVTGANCSAQIRNESYDVKDNLNMNEIGGGWYNQTYNVSKTGKYFCRQNCTQGTFYAAETCDFIVEMDDSMGITLAIAAIMIFILLYYIYMARFFGFENLNENGGFKLMFYILVFWLMLIPANFAVYLSDTYLLNEGMSSTIGIFYTTLIYVNVLITFYFVLWIIIQLFKKISIKRRV